MKLEKFMLLAHSQKSGNLIKSLRVFNSLEDAIAYYAEHYYNKDTEPSYTWSTIYKVSDDKSPIVVMKSRALYELVSGLE